MRLRFFGTRGYVEESSPTHRHHSAFTVEAEGFRLLCDFGESHKGTLPAIAPDAIWISHAHPDHSWGLEEGSQVPVYASAITHEITARMPLSRRVAVAPGVGQQVGPFRLTGYPVAHSVRCPAMAVRLESSGATLVYSGDIVAFEDPAAVLSEADLYVGDGSTLKGSLVRRHASGALLGHTTVRAQLSWLAKARVPRAVFSHFGKGPIEMGDEAVRDALVALAKEKAPECRVEAAADGWETAVSPQIAGG
ncbi:MAG TPA: MBL fold metallo-hydrolase [Thermoanaerobaculia bacterium]